MKTNHTHPKETDRHLYVRKRSFTFYLLFQFIFTFYTLYLTFTYPENNIVYLSSTALTMVFPLLALYFSKKYFKETVRIFSIYNWISAACFLLLINGNMNSDVLIAFIFLTISVYSCLLINLRWGLAYTILTLIVFFVDFMVEASFPELGKNLSPISKVDFLIIFFCLYLVIVAFVGAYTYLLKQSLQGYNEEFKLRKNVQKELEEVNVVLKDMNSDLEEHMAYLEEANNKLATYAYKNAHEVRAPLCRLLGLVYLLDKVEAKEEQDFIVRQIKESTHEMNKVVLSMNELLQGEEIIKAALES